MENPYLDSNFKDKSIEVKELAKLIEHDLNLDKQLTKQYYAQVIADLYFHWKHNTFETVNMVQLKDMALDNNIK